MIELRSTRGLLLDLHNDASLCRRYRQSAQGTLAGAHAEAFRGARVSRSGRGIDERGAQGLHAGTPWRRTPRATSDGWQAFREAAVPVGTGDRVWRVLTSGGRR